MIPFEQYTAAAAALRERLPFQAGTAIVLGSSLGAFSEKVEQPTTVPYGDIPGFPISTALSHAGVLVGGTLRGIPVLILSGRFHYYEGYAPQTVAFYVRVLKLLGIRTLILTNAAGGVNPSFDVGDLMLITDHIGFLAESPVRGAHESAFGERFFDMTDAYSKRLRGVAAACAQESGIPLREGVYFYTAGPAFETPAEIRAIGALGADAVGMSTVPETVAAVGCGLEVLGISCITNPAAGVEPDSVVSGGDALRSAAEASGRFGALLEAVVVRIHGK